MADEPETTSQVENQTPSQEDYNALKAELQAERDKSVELVAEAVAPLEIKIADLEGQLQAAQAETKTLSDNFEGAKAAYAYAVEDFKKLAVESNPLIPAESIYGTTIEEVKTSVERASALVARVKQSLQEQAQATSIPAGAPARTEPDLSALSTKEKINYGLNQAKRKKD